MIINLIRLKNKLDEYIEIDETYTFDESYLKQTDILTLDNISIKGDITLDSMDEYVLSLMINGIMVLPCAVTLIPVDYPFSINIQGNLEQILKEIDENAKKIENTIDILPIIWENILMEIPMRVVSKEADAVHLEGDGWKLITEHEEVEEINPALAALKDLL